MAKPTELPIFNTNDTNSTAPTSIRQTDGWQSVGGVPEKPSYQNFNYLQNRNWKWFKYFDEREQTLTHNMASDGDYTLATEENSFGRIVITDTSVLLTATRNIILDDNQRSVIVQNDTLQTITFKTVLGTGVSINAGDFNTVYNDGTNVISNSTSLEIASTAEAQAGTNNTKAISPLRLREGLNATGASPIMATRVMIAFKGTGVISIIESRGVSSIIDLGVGRYRLALQNFMNTNTFVITLAGSREDGLGTPVDLSYENRTTSGFDIGSSDVANNRLDIENISATIVQ